MNIRKVGRIGIVLFAVSGVLIATGVAIASTAGGHGEGGWAPTDTYRVMNFAVLAIALFFLLRKPATQFLNDRIHGIRQQLSDLEEQKKAAERKLAEYNDKLSALNLETEKIIDQYRKQGEAARQKILQEAETAAAKLEEQARRTIENEFAQAKLKLESEIFEKAIAKAESKLKNLITDNDQEQLVQEYLNKVVIK